MKDRLKFRIWNGSEMHHNDFVVTATGYVGKIIEEFLGQCVFKQDDLTADNECILMQCTGLKDKNGKLIYEGDIVKFVFGNKYKNGEVTYSQTIWSVSNAQFVNREYVGGALINLYSTCEVIGNIYENPELIFN